MKNIAFILLAFILLAFFSCKKVANENMTVVKNCTGMYLQFKGKDYHVCNIEKVASFQNGAAVTATFTKLNTCNGTANDQFVCDMIHANEGWVNVDEIK